MIGLVREETPEYWDQYLNWPRQPICGNVWHEQPTNDWDTIKEFISECTRQFDEECPGYIIKKESLLYVLELIKMYLSKRPYITIDTIAAMMSQHA